MGITALYCPSPRSCDTIQSMSIQISHDVEAQLRRLAQARGRDVDALAQEAVEQYLVASSITDVTAEEIAQSQARLSPELPEWSNDANAAR